MTATSSHGSSTRRPLVHAGRAVPNVTTRRKADGTTVYELLVKTKGRRTRKVLDAKTPTDAIREAERLLPVVRQGRGGDRSVRVEPLFERMLTAMKDGSFTFGGRPYAERTVALMEQRAESHVLDALGRSTRVADVKAADLRAMMRRLSAKGLSGSTVRGCLAVASAVLRFAVEYEVVDRNVSRDIGRGERPSSKRRSEPLYLSVPEVEDVLAKMTDESRPIAAAMFYGALRVSEALALRWSDVGTDTLRVRGTKTEASDATIPLLPRLAAELRAHRERMGTLGFRRIGPDALVFQTRSGRPVSRRNVLRAVQAAGRAAGVSTDDHPLGNHDLRHSMAANALGLGLSMTETARLLRHANPQVTATVYAHLAEDGVSVLAEKLQGLGS
jgi:integrase